MHSAIDCNFNCSKLSPDRISGSLVLVILAFLCVNGWPDAGALAAEVRDAHGRTVTVADTSRIVSIGGAVTEILFALGLGDRVVAVDQTSRYPAAAQTKPDVGYSRTLSAEGVLSMAPSVILAAEGAGPRSTLDVLESASVPVVIIPEAHSRAGVRRKIEAVAAAVGEEARGRALADEVDADFAAVDAMVKALPDKPRAVFVLSIAGGAPMVGGAETSADAIFRLAGLTNAMGAIKGFKLAQDEAAMTAEPDTVVVMQGGGQVLTPEAVFALPAFRGTPAARENRIVALPGSYLLAFGPRAPRAARDLAAAARPGTHLPELPPRTWSTEADR